MECVSIEANQDLEYRTFGEVSNWDTVSNQLQIVFKSVKYDFLVITTIAMKMERHRLTGTEIKHGARSD